MKGGEVGRWGMPAVGLGGISGESGSLIGRGIYGEGGGGQYHLCQC